MKYFRLSFKGEGEKDIFISKAFINGYYNRVSLSMFIKDNGCCLDLLNDLRIYRKGFLVVTLPENNPILYNKPPVGHSRKFFVMRCNHKRLVEFITKLKEKLM